MICEGHLQTMVLSAQVSSQANSSDMNEEVLIFSKGSEVSAVESGGGGEKGFSRVFLGFLPFTRF